MKLKKDWIYLSLIIIATIVVFFSALDGVYLNWDDDQQIVNNADVLNLSWQSFKNYFTTFYVASYQPLASLSFGIEYYLFGNNPFVPHFTNLILHLFNVILVYSLLKRIITNQKVFLFFIVGAFAIHPFQAELLGWISTRSTLLCSSFLLLTCIQYQSYIIKKEHNKKHYWFALLLFTLSLLSKSTAVVLPFVLILFDYLYKRKFTLKLFLEKSLFFTGSIMIGIVSLISREVADSQGSFNDYYTLYEKISISSFSVFQYLNKSFFPEDLVFFYGYPFKLIEGGSIELKFLLAPIWVAFIVLFCWIVYRKTSSETKRLWIFGVAFFIINIMIVVNVTTFSATFFAERYMYLAIIGVFLSIAFLAQILVKNTPILKNGVYIVLVIFLVTLALKTRERSSLWTTDFKLWSYIEKAKGQTSTPYRKLGQIYANKGNTNKAVEIYNNGIKINPYSIDLYYWRALSIIELGDLEYAKKDLSRVIASKHKLKGDAFYQKSLIFKKQNELDSARINIDSAKVYNNQLALFDGGVSPSLNNFKTIESNILKRVDSFIRSKNFKEAIVSYDNLLMLMPKSTVYLLEKGKLEVQILQFKEAIDTFTKVLELDKQSKTARLSRAYIYTLTKQNTKSIEDYTYAIENFKNINGEVYYFRALAYFNSKQTQLGCIDIDKAKQIGYKIPSEIDDKICKN